MTNLLLLLVVFQNTLDFRCERRKSETLCSVSFTRQQESARHTVSADMICSGAIVFLLSASHISLASEDIKWMNSTTKSSVHQIYQGHLCRRSPTQHSMTRSRVSFAQTISLGSSSVRVNSPHLGRRDISRLVPAIILATVALGSDRSSSVGAPPPECPSRSDISIRASYRHEKSKGTNALCVGERGPCERTCKEREVCSSSYMPPMSSQHLFSKSARALFQPPCPLYVSRCSGAFQVLIRSSLI